MYDTLRNRLIKGKQMDDVEQFNKDHKEISYSRILEGHKETLLDLLEEVALTMKDDFSLVACKVRSAIKVYRVEE